MMDGDPLQTQRDVGSAVVTELPAAGFDNAEEIGRGGFGIVYRCTQVDLDRTVAVKVLTAEPDENRERFLREQRAMGRLTGHPNIVSVLQVGETDNGYPYLVMQYHRQGSMEARIRRLGPLPLDEVLRLGVKMAAALHTAHRVGILHRDVKPANILLTDCGYPYLVMQYHRQGSMEARIRRADPPTCTGSAPPCSARSPAMPRSNAAAASRWLPNSCASPASRRRICARAASPMTSARSSSRRWRATRTTVRPLRNWVSRFSSCRRVTAYPSTKWRCGRSRTENRGHGRRPQVLTTPSGTFLWL